VSSDDDDDDDDGDNEDEDDDEGDSESGSGDGGSTDDAVNISVDLLDSSSDVGDEAGDLPIIPGYEIDHEEEERFVLVRNTIVNSINSF